MTSASRWPDLKRSFGSKDTERIWHEQYVEGVGRTVQRAALRKLELIHAARDVEDLRVPPGNLLERLVGDRRGQHTIRLARFFGTSEEFWMNLQSHYELRVERRALRDEMARITPLEVA